MSALPIEPIPCLSDNYAWIFPTGPGEVAVVDPGEEAPVHDWLEERKLRAAWILLTHHHGDHTGGARSLVARHGSRLVGAAEDRQRLPPLDLAVEGGQILPLGTHNARVIAVPGHTSGHVAYLVQDALFAGDALFAWGCGRVFEGTPEQMWSSMVTLRELAADARLCCGHEYTLANLHFACHLLPDDPRLTEATLEAQEHRRRGTPTLPVSMAEQRASNPFLRCDDADLAAEVGLSGHSADQVFARIRMQKDRFRG